MASIQNSRPTSVIEGIKFNNIGQDKVEMVVDVLIKNPTPYHVAYVDAKYSLQSDGKTLLSGSIPDIGELHAHGEKTVNILDTLNIADFKSMISFNFKIEITVNLPIIGKVHIIIEKNGKTAIAAKSIQ